MTGREGGTLRASAGFALSQYLARAVVLGRGLLAASVLGPQGFGGWNALNLILDYGYFAPAASLQGLDVRLPATVERDERDLARRQMAGALGVTLVGALVFSALVLLLPGSGARELVAVAGAGAAPLMLVAAVLQLGLLYFASALRAHQRFGAVSRGLSVQALVGGGVGIALLWSWGIWGLILGWIAGTLVAVILMRAAVPEAPLRPSAAGEGLAMIRAGLPIFSFYVLSLVLRSTDRIAFVHYGQVAALGQYGLGLMASSLVFYAPESLGFVLFPRMAAAAQGARDAAATRAELLRAQRLLAALLPLPVALGMVWAGPVVGAWLPAYGAGVPALRWLAFGSLLVSAGTLPGYFLLASGRHRRLLTVGALAVVVNALLVFPIAARDPRPVAVAAAVVAGYAIFGLGMAGAAASELFAGFGARARFLAASFAPPVAIGATTLALTRSWPVADVSSAGLASLAVLLIATPVVLLSLRGVALPLLVPARSSSR